MEWIVGCVEDYSGKNQHNRTTECSWSETHKHPQN